MSAVFKNAVVPSVGSSNFTAIYTATSKAAYIIECDIACTTLSGVQISVRVKKGNGTSAYVIKNAPVPPGSTIQVIDGQKLVLEVGDSLEAKCETADSTVDVIVSLVDGVND